MSGFARFLERKVTFIYLILFAGIMWPPDAYFAGEMVTPQGQSNIYDFLEFALLVPFLGFGFLALRRQLPQALLVAWPVLALCVMAFLSAYWSDYPALVVRRAGTLTLSTLFGIYIAVRGDFADLIASLVKVFAIAAVASFFAIVALPQAATVTGEYYTHAWRGAFTDKNELGMACGEAIIISVYAWRRGYGPRWLSLGTLGAFLVLLAGSQSKTPIVFMTAALYAAMIVLALRRRSAGGLIVGYALLVAGILGSAILAMTWQDVLLALGRDPTFTNRTRIWQLAFEYIDFRPWLGYGFGAFWQETSADAQIFWASLGFKTPHAHNSWLEIVLGVGLIGFVFAVLSWLAVFYRTLRVATAPHAVHVAFCLAFLAAILIENFSEYEFFRSGRLMWALFVAILTYLGREVILHRAAARRAMPVARPPIVIAPLRGAALP
jgi:O-antigen ligase